MWLAVIISAYFILAVVSLVDKYLLGNSLINPKVYVFYVGVLGGLSVFIIPFIEFLVSEPVGIAAGIIAGISFILGLFWYYKALVIFEASRVIPAIGGLIPIFTFILVYFFFGGGGFSLSVIISFLLLVFGSVLIVAKKGKFVNFGSFKMSVLAAFFISISILLSKYAYMALDFWPGFVWKNVGGLLAALFFFIIFPEIKKEVFKNKEKRSAKTAAIFLGNQAMGGAGSILQNWAISLAPSFLYVAFINALQGIEYVFLLIFSVLLSLRFPNFVKEEVLRETIIQKIIAIFFIAGGLAILAF